jgi:arginyl-tRNA--protein-N-Asp/Glu arginylyltransferase
METSRQAEHFYCLDVAPSEMDRLWAAGWRHFGIVFFRYRTAQHGPKEYNVLPLRIDITRFAPGRAQRRVLKRNRDAAFVIRAASFDDTKETLFAAHRQRFSENVPESLHDFLSPLPATMPCTNLELCVYLGGKLVGVTFLDLGASATSAVYAIFDPAHYKRSLGILMILRSIEFSRDHGFRYYYPGYAYREPFAYDYKKQFIGLEYLDWESGWKPYDNSRFMKLF